MPCYAARSGGRGHGRSNAGHAHPTRGLVADPPPRCDGAAQLCRPRCDRNRRAQAQGRFDALRGGVRCRRLRFFVDLRTGAVRSRLAVRSVLCLSDDRRGARRLGARYPSHRLRQWLRDAGRSARDAWGRRRRRLSQRLEDHRTPCDGRAKGACQRRGCGLVSLGARARDLRRWIDFALFRLAADLLHLWFADLAVDRPLAIRLQAAMAQLCTRQRQKRAGKQGHAQPHGLADGCRPLQQHLWLLFSARLAAFVSGQGARHPDPRNDWNDHDRLRRSGVWRSRLGLVVRPPGKGRMG